MKPPTYKEIHSAKLALEGLLASKLLRSSSVEVFLATLPSETEFEFTGETRLEELTSDLLGYLSSAVEYLRGMLTGVSLDRMATEMATHLGALLRASLAFDDLPVDMRAEYQTLLAYCPASETTLA